MYDFLIAAVNIEDNGTRIIENCGMRMYLFPLRSSLNEKKYKAITFEIKTNCC